ncbi:flavin reductase family protein [candidate division NPL-UPA2 bacterium]|nr:flavin reductase family protein [candidate division NPL-UPA2 bacterium]
MREVSVSEVWKRKYPEPVVLVTSVDEKGKPNIIALGWSMPTSFEPPMLAISVGKTRYSHKLISEGKEFVLAFPQEGMKDEVLYCGTHSGRKVDKFKETGLTAQPAKEVRPPLMEECLVNMECKVVGELDTGDHTIFAGRIVRASVSEEEGQRLYSLGGERLGGVRESG